MEVPKRVGPSWQGKGKQGGKADLQEAALIVLNVRPAMVITGKPPIRDTGNVKTGQQVAGRTEVSWERFRVRFLGTLPEEK